VVIFVPKSWQVVRPGGSQRGSPAATSSDLILIKAGQVLAAAYEPEIGRSPKVSGKAWRLAALLSFPLSPLRVPDGGFIAGQPGRARSLSCT
jgi:hypothetical protein